MYQQYLILFAEITRNKKAIFNAQDEEIFIQSPREGVWILDLPLLKFEGKVPSKVAECLFSCSLQSFQSVGPQIKKSGQEIILNYVTKAPESFVAFKTLLNQYIFHAKEWRETLRELCRQSPSRISKDILFFAS